MPRNSNPYWHVLTVVALALLTAHGAEEKKIHRGAKGTDFAAKERNTERLQALRKRVAEYEAALARGIPPPAPPRASYTYERPPDKDSGNLTPRERVVRDLKAKPMDKSNLAALRNYLSTSSNRMEKASLGTAYCLGCLVTDQWSEGARMAILVRKAYPKAEPVKLLTLAPFATDCRKCSASGKTDVKCGTCKGRKKCQFYDCAGGTLRNPDLRIGGKAPNCPQCAGTDECRLCKGTGKIDQRCGECSGRGKTLRLESIEKGYLKFVREIGV